MLLGDELPVIVIFEASSSIDKLPDGLPSFYARMVNRRMMALQR